MSSERHILTPLQDPLPAEAAQILENYPRRDGYLLQLFRLFANSTRFLTKGVANLLDQDSPISTRQREIVILRTTAKNRCEYEWGVHVVAFGAATKLTEAQVKDTAAVEPDPSLWRSEELILIQMVDELCDKSTLSDPVLLTIQETFTREQQLEILALCGNYHTVSFVANASRLDNEPFGARFPT